MPSFFMYNRSMAKKKRIDLDAIEYIQRYKSPLIKWYTTNISNEDKFRLGLMTYPEYLAWQEELAREVAEADSGSDTFWRGDTGNRENMSEDEYEDFLSQNSIDVSNRTAIDFEALAASLQGGELGETGEAGSSIAELSMEEILANVNRDIHGGNTMLSADEIEALFNAYNSGGEGSDSGEENE